MAFHPLHLYACFDRNFDRVYTLAIENTYLDLKKLNSLALFEFVGVARPVDLAN